MKESATTMSWRRPGASAVLAVAVAAATVALAGSSGAADPVPSAQRVVIQNDRDPDGQVTSPDSRSPWDRGPLTSPVIGFSAG